MTIHSASNHTYILLRAALALTLSAAALLLTAGCDNPLRTAGRAVLSGESKAVEEWVGDPVALTTVKTVAVLPFDDRSPEAGFSDMTFSTQLANAITSRGRVRVIYPNEVMAAVKKENVRIRQHNSTIRQKRMLGQVDAEGGLVSRGSAGPEGSSYDETNRPKEPLDPVRNLDDAVRIGRILKADAILMGTVLDCDPYMRPRLSLAMKVVATGITDAAAMEIAELTQWGIPRSPSTANGVVWFRQQNFDSETGNIGRNVKLHALQHYTEHHPYDTEIYVRSMDSYYEYVSAVLAHSFLEARDAAMREAEDRAVAQAKHRKETERGMAARMRRLMEPDPVLPDPEQIVARNLGDRRDKNWEPDVYNRAHPEKGATAYVPRAEPR